jgi:dinuclear metal center YbgI/SA1388 family protein
MTTVADLLPALEALAPLALAEEWDNVGLLLGDPQTAVQRVLTCLTVTLDSVAEAIDAKVQLIVTHHPILFRAAKKLTSATPEGGMLLRLVQAGIAVYSAHTAYDNAAGGINDQLAQKLGLTDVRALRPRPARGQCKIVVFVPEKDLSRVSDALFAAGAGDIGQYRECGFRLSGVGTFFGSEGANPTVGQKGRREEVAEWRLEVICPDAAVAGAVAAMRAAHSYEEPAYDVYPLRPATAVAKVGGAGRIGSLPTPLSLRDFARTVQSALQASAVQIVGHPARTVQRVALACGAAGEFLADALTHKADVFLTGELRFHDALAAQAQSLALVLPGHYASERCGMETLAARLLQQFPALKIWASERESDPSVFV